MNYVLNGDLIEGDSIAISLNSKTFNFGIGVFETIKILDGRPCFLKEHYDRLSKSALNLFLKFELSLDELRSQVIGLCLSNSLQQGAIKVLCFENSGRSDILVMLREYSAAGDEPFLLSVSNMVRSSNSVSALNKTLNYAENILELSRAQSHGYDDCLFLNENGMLTESAIANIFFIADGKLKTPAVNCGLLEGIIRNQVMGLTEEMGFLVEEGTYSLSEMKSAESVFLTNSLKGIRSVRRIEFGSEMFNFEQSTLVKRLSLRLEEIELESL